MNDHTGTRIQEVRTVSVPIGDVDRARDFYTDTLGFEVRLDVPAGRLKCAPGSEPDSRSQLSGATLRPCPSSAGQRSSSPNTRTGRAGTTRLSSTRKAKSGR
ncbi:MAG: hypothetical protein HGA82_03790 [Anaerolineales bacterium]|nr:hypothetical protein [Anaerolineales bacterium]